jgi:predicted Zn finger-like uncharacterized protein
MAEITSCPHCQRKLRVPAELLGRQVKCPGCGQQFTASVAGAAPAPPPPPPPPPPPVPGQAPAYSYQQPQVPTYGGEEFEADTERGRDRGEIEGWTKVRTGVTYILIALCVNLGVSILVGCIGGVLGASQASSGGRPGGGTQGLEMGLNCINGLVGLVCFGLTIAGQIFCLSAPDRYGARTLARTSLGLFVGAIIFVILGVILIIAGMAGSAVNFGSDPARMLQGFIMSAGIGLVVIALGYIALIAQNVVFLLFMRATALAVEARGLAQSIGYLLGVFGALVLTVIGMVAVVFSMASGASASRTAKEAENFMAGGGAMILGCVCLLVILALTYFIWYIVTMVQVRGSIDSYIRRARHMSY